jgi:diguanylate cyclase (GGDEF)-like protein/PAS domain S-box-containing protein
MKKKSVKTLKSVARPDVERPMVLAVDDEVFMRRTCREALEEAGFRVEEASSGKEALDLFLRLRPALVILDLVMPEMDGYETCAYLRLLKEGRHTPILAVTGLQDTASILKAYESGASDCISKPVDGELLACRARYLVRAGRALEELDQNEARLELLGAGVESLPIGITLSDAEGRIIYTNSAEAAMHGYKVEELMHQDARILAPERLHGARLLEKTKKCGVWRRESVNWRKGGEEFPVQLSSVVVRNARKEFLGTATICEDITERKKNEQKIHQLAYFDPLTGLPNRTLFLDRLQKALASTDRSRQAVAVLLLDLDNFKDINDTQGHEFGDKLLKEVARRLSSCIRAADTLARLGGDEFVVMSAVRHEKTAGSIAFRIQENFRPPFEIDGRLTYAGFSIGIALYPNDAPDLEVLLRCADTAMYRAKAGGRQNSQFFSPEMNREIMEKVALEYALREALDRQELTLCYQPQWDLQTGSRCVVEVLARWRHPELGDISPARFIPLAESSGLIYRLGEWVLRSACTQAKVWAEAGCPVERVAVNISGHQLRQPDFTDLIDSVLAETKLDPARLELEFTEGVLMEHAGQTATIMQTLKGMGIQLSIDDFGTGYSSLSYLKHFPIDRIKIDRAFVAGIERDPGDTAIVTAVIALAHTLKIKVLAEGVETRAQLEFLQESGCSEGQGFFLGAPMKAEELVRWLEVESEIFVPGTKGKQILALVSSA